MVVVHHPPQPCFSRRTTYCMVSTDDQPDVAHKNSGFIVATGTGSTAWMYVGGGKKGYLTRRSMHPPFPSLLVLPHPRAGIMTQRFQSRQCKNCCRLQGTRARQLSLPPKVWKPHAKKKKKKTRQKRQLRRPHLRLLTFLLRTFSFSFPIFSSFLVANSYNQGLIFEPDRKQMFFTARAPIVGESCWPATFLSFSCFLFSPHQTPPRQRSYFFFLASCSTRST